MNRYEEYIVKTGKTAYPLTDEGDQAHYIAVLRDKMRSEGIDKLSKKRGYTKDLFGNFWNVDSNGKPF